MGASLVKFSCPFPTIYVLTQPLLLSQTYQVQPLTTPFTVPFLYMPDTACGQVLLVRCQCAVLIDLFFLQRRFLAAFNDIQDISYEVELMSRGRVILDMTNSPVSGSCD